MQWKKKGKDRKYHDHWIIHAFSRVTTPQLHFHFSIPIVHWFAFMQLLYNCPTATTLLVDYLNYRHWLPLVTVSSEMCRTRAQWKSWIIKIIESNTTKCLYTIHFSLYFQLIQLLLWSNRMILLLPPRKTNKRALQKSESARNQWQLSWFG